MIQHEWIRTSRYKHYLLYLPPFDLTDRLETRQQTLVLLLSNCCCAHNACIRELLQEVNVHGKADRHMKLLTIETESRLGTLWDQEECNQLCSKEEL